MAVLNFARGRAAGLSRGPILVNRAIGVNHKQSRLRTALEVGGTLLVLMLIAVGILALRLALVLAHGVCTEKANRYELASANLPRRLGDMERARPVATPCGASSEPVGEHRVRPP